jgi:hypothetical protein
MCKRGLVLNKIAGEDRIGSTKEHPEPGADTQLQRFLPLFSHAIIRIRNVQLFPNRISKK